MTATRSNLTAEVARELLAYCPETGSLRWRERGREWFSRDKDWVQWNRRYAGLEAGCVHTRKSGYKSVVVRISGRLYPASHLAWLIVTGEYPHQLIDHEDQNALNNAWGNLREVDRAGNGQNVPRARNNTSGVTGVHWFARTGKWMAYIGLNGRHIHLGYHGNLFDAVAARKSAENTFGFHENHGKEKRVV